MSPSRSTSPSSSSATTSGMICAAWWTLSARFIERVADDVDGVGGDIGKGDFSDFHHDIGEWLRFLVGRVLGLKVAVVVGHLGPLG